MIMLETVPDPTINITDAVIILIALFMVYVLPILIRLKADGKKRNENSKDVKAIKNYIKDKGVDDFIEECKKWEKRKYITTNAFARLDCRYKRLGDLGADGERDAHWKLVCKLDMRDEED